jgi:hypothetical protein
LNKADCRWQMTSQMADIRCQMLVVIFTDGGKPKTF